MSATAIDRRTCRALGAAAYAVGALTLGPCVAEAVAAGGGVGRPVWAAGAFALVAVGWNCYGEWLPARIASLYFLGLSAGTLGGAVTAIV